MHNRSTKQRRAARRRNSWTAEVEKCKRLTDYVRWYMRKSGYMRAMSSGIVVVPSKTWEQWTWRR